MTECPDVDALVARDPSALRHASSCPGCAAVSSLADVHDARLTARSDECVDAEVSLALQCEGLLDAEQSAVLDTHLERCFTCNEVAARAAAARRAFVPEARSAGRGARTWGLALGFVAVAAASLALGASWQSSRARSEERAVAEAPIPRPVPAPPGAGVEPATPAPCPTPVPSETARVAPSPPRAVRSSGVVDPWGPSPSPSAAPGVGYLTIMCTPACDSVTAGGKSLGASPVLRAPLPSGRVNVELRRADVRKLLVVEIVAGRVSARSVSMVERDGLVDPWR